MSEKKSTATGVVKEIVFAKSQDVPICGVYVDGANSSTRLPDGLFRSKTVAWDWEKIADMIDNAKKEGKNK